MITCAGPTGSDAVAPYEACSALRRVASRTITRPGTTGAMRVVRWSNAHSAAAAAITAAMGKQSTHKRLMITTPSKDEMGALWVAWYHRIAENLLRQAAIIRPSYLSNSRQFQQFRPIIISLQAISRR
jgi:hypothetical protein